MATKFCTVVPQYATCCFMSPTWRLEFRGGSSSFFLIRAPLLKTVVFQLVVYVESLWLNLNFYETPVKKK
jgi:hypothetical protein